MNNYRNLNRHGIFRLINSEIKKKNRGDEFTLPELLGRKWLDLELGSKRQASKDFLISVKLKEITSVYFKPYEKRSNAYIYVKR